MPGAPSLMKCEIILWVSEGQSSRNFEFWVPHPCAVCKGAVFRSTNSIGCCACSITGSEVKTPTLPKNGKDRAPSYYLSSGLPAIFFYHAIAPIEERMSHAPLFVSCRHNR